MDYDGHDYDLASEANTTYRCMDQLLSHESILLYYDGSKKRCQDDGRSAGLVKRRRVNWARVLQL